VGDEQGQAPTGTTDQGSTSTEGNGSGTQAPSADELARARSEAARYRTELREAQQKLEDAEAKQKERDDAEKSELEKAVERAKALEGEVAQRDTKLRDLTLAQEVYTRAAKLDIVDPDAAFRLLDKGQVVYDGDRPQNIDDLLTTLVEDRPYLRKKGAGTTKKEPATTTSTTQPDGQKTKAPLTRADIEKMTDDEVAERLEEVQAVMAADL